ncbi:hypothetical protein [Saccharothrix lopnurensis]|uniref:Uncharacterized protein n=1 Tax=Saccharothrix lopnurensis TaxID=1670621 RepID=A0ABW1P0L7_9PSEU
MGAGVDVEWPRVGPGEHEPLALRDLPLDGVTGAPCARCGRALPADLPASHLPFVEGRVTGAGREGTAGCFARHREHVFRGRRHSPVGGPG